MEQAYALTLEEARQEALLNNLSKKISKEIITEKQSDRKKQFTEFFPAFSINSYASHVTAVPKSTIEAGSGGSLLSTPIPQKDIVTELTKQDNAGVSAKVEQPVFQGGKLYYGYNMKKATEEWSEWNDQQTALDIIFRTEDSYFKVIKAEERKKYAQEHVATLKTHLADVEVRYKMGAAIPNDVLRVKVELAQAEKMVISAESEIKIAKTWLNAALNRPMDAPLETTMVGSPEPVTITMAEAEELAIANQPSLKGSRAQVKEAFYNRKVSEAEYYPHIDASAEYSQLTDQPVYPEQNWTFMVNLKWSVFEWGKTDYDVSAMKSIELQREYSLADLQNNIRAATHEAWLHVREADVSLNVARENLKFAEENLKVVKIGYAYGKYASTALLEAEDLLVKTQSDYVDAEYNAHYTRAALRHVIGIPVAEVSKASNAN